MFRAVDYDDGLHRGYELGRGLSWDAVMAWRAALTRWLPHQRPLAVLELGSGTGRFSRFIADVGGGRVYAVEPSHRMRAIAVAEHRHDRVHCLAGRAEAIPLAAASCDAAVLFFVLHHVADLEAAAGELARVLRDGGRVLVAGSFSERLHPRTYYRYLPRAREIESELFPKLEDVARTFGKTGLTITGFDEVEHEGR
ncbi:class I SAM-dependent methyltransferase [Mycobacterium persicum]|uniref:class I SAM-dependent methyltransferase n=1 Tax=Mycobacterium persicum TaxID=1487726 RepID=UPI0009F2B119|nr:methyltransferase domain-containing protein [Mycobacterium persicum]ORB51559.1 hypothetical protein BST40_10240 [Mycobacterium persicum]ORC04033.1 hypothetical protein B1T48_25155 [Mycobacterium persicum]